MNKKIKKTVLITGGAGFIGSSLILSLQDRYKIICLDQGNNYSEFKKFINNNVKLIKGDITDENLLDGLIKNCQIIIHLAGGGGNSACANDPVWAIRTHILGTHVLLKKALKYKVKKIIFSSSVFAYSTFKKRKLPITENVELEPDDFYGTLKKIAEDLIRDSKIDYSILRFANVYGRSEFFPIQSGGAINNFVKSAFAREDIQIYGSGSQGIDYVHFKDVVEAVNSVLEKGPKNSVYNVGSGKLMEIEEIAEMVKNIFKDDFRQETRIKKISAPANKIWPDRLMSIKKMERDLGWKPKTSFKTGLEEIIHNYPNKR